MIEIETAMKELVLIVLLIEQLQEKITQMIPQAILDAIGVETQQGQAMQTENANLKAKLVEKDTLIAELQAMVASGAATQAELAAKIAQLEANAVDIQAVADAIAAINPTPVSDAVVGEVVSNPEIPTPPVVEAAPPVAPEVVQEPAVVEAALDALDQFTEEEAEG